MDFKVLIFQTFDGADAFVKAYVKGADGLPGLKGDPGNLIWKGDWVITTSYAEQDVVQYEGSSYVSKTNSNAGNLPTNTSYWDILVSKGTDGDDGLNGTNGKTWYTGSVDPTTQGVDGDLYLNSTSYDVFEKASGTWSLLGNIKGVAGDDGVNGKTLLSGTVDPTTEGTDNDFYLNTTSCDLFKKLSGTWTLQVNIKGAQGNPGVDGISVVWHGAYDAGHAYIINDAVSYSGSSYICILASTGNLPTNTTYWNVLASKGDSGASAVPGIGEIRIFNSASIDPNSIWSGTTWSRIDGGFLGMYKSGDANFGTAGAAVSGGAKTKDMVHTHSTPALTHSGTAVDAHNVTPMAQAFDMTMPMAAAITALSIGDHTVTQPAQHSAGTSGNGLSTTQDVLNPGWVVCVWQRTA